MRAFPLAGPAALWQAWWRALGLRAPLFGDVTEAFTSPLVQGSGDQLGFININSNAVDAALERRIVEEVASYGRQLGRLLDAVDVLIRRDTRGKLARDDQRALDELQTLRAEIGPVLGSVSGAARWRLLIRVSRPPG